ncbi:MAG: sulfatase-like hydrolase/transferase, partial [Kiritimatiellia bacterium]
MSQKPNIILIITEQQRGDCLSSDGHPVLLTPNMDEIVANGARFSRCYSDCPICMPARRTILSGQFPATHGLLSNKEGLEWQPAATMAQVLRDQGYQTRWIGRSMHQYPQQARFGYDEVENGGSDPDSEYGSWLKANAPNDCGGWHGAGVMHNDWTARPWPLPEYLHNTNWTVERGLRFLRRRDPTCPFFLTLSFLAAHPPLQPPAPYFERYLRTGVPDPYIGDWAVPPDEPYGVSSKKVNLRGEALLSARAGYYGLINHLDDQLRRILNPVVGQRQGQDTIVCLTSDHGEMLGDH